MRIILINHYAGSLYYGMEFRPYYIARQWVNSGHEVYIIAGDYSHLRIHNPVIHKDFEQADIDGIHYLWVKTGRYQGNGVKRALTMFRFTAKLRMRAAKLAKALRPNLVISSSTYPLDNIAAEAIARKAGATLVHESHDLWPLTLTSIGGMSTSHPFVRLMQWAENRAYSRSDRVISLFPNALPHMMAHHLGNEKKFGFVPNGIALEDWEHPSPLPEEHQKLLDHLTSQGKFIVLYCGGHAISNALDTMVKAASLCDNDRIAFVLVGSGTCKASLQQMARQLGCTNIDFLPPVSKAAIPTLLRRANVLYIGSTESVLGQYGVSFNKVYDYLMSGRPSIYGVKSFNNEIAQADAGLTITPGSPQSLLDAINTLAALPEEERLAMGARGKSWVSENRSYDQIAREFLRVCQPLKE